MPSRHGTAQAGRLGPLVALIVALIAFAVVAWSGITGASKEATPAPTGAPITAGTAAPEQPDARLQKYYSQQLSWAKCNDGFQCASLTVPLDYEAPDGQTIQIAMLRLPASDSKKRLGSLVLNPGGPGGSGIEYAKSAQLVTSSALRSVYDIVGFDPRGVGESEPVRCLNTAEADMYLANDGTPDTPAERGTIISTATDIGALCAERAAKIAPHIDTESAARDIDIMRAALGDEKLNWLGKSYGTYLGATYATFFPGRVGRMVLDGAVTPDEDLVAQAEDQAMGFETALDRYLADCVRSGSCPAGKSVKTARATITSWLQKADRTPYPTDDPKRPLTESLITYGLLLGLYDTTYGWDSLTLALEGLANGEGAPMLAMVDLFTQRENGKYLDNGLDALNAVTCLDNPVRPSLAQVEASAAKMKTKAPIFGEWIAWGALSCSYWPYPASWNGEINVKGTNDILVIGTQYDPATPVQWATALRNKIENGRLITWLGGDGHTAYMQPGAKCVDRIVDAFFVQGLSPKDGVNCTKG